MSGCLRTLSFEGSGDRKRDGIWFENLLLGGSTYSWSVKCLAVFKMDLPDIRLEKYESSLHLFVIAREKEGSDHFFRTQGLVLARTRLVNGQFRRCGMFVIGTKPRQRPQACWDSEESVKENDEGNIGKPRWISKWFKGETERRSGIPRPLEYEIADKGNYIISIV